MHTKGKWTIDPKKEEGGYHIFNKLNEDERGRSESIAFVFPFGESTMSNAKLIAAAPRMHELLQSIYATRNGLSMDLAESIRELLLELEAK